MYGVVAPLHHSQSFLLAFVGIIASSTAFDKFQFTTLLLVKYARKEWGSKVCHP
jgi:hypothetical protein